MKYPVSLNKYMKDIYEITSKWSTNVDFDDVIKWILQFDVDDYDIAYE
ncbi:hypothetical protein [Clostridium beijerinckii]|uniref:Uncharacterized protein n=1 Tax=Clostridium beijerinckii TaxID=1520 RepID=A0A9Q5GRF7_CLOBE|nr:hypothetical protein [Clostridium beijerinckii]MBA2887357.1 hypothetical protein [Clostridium beijerinckii]MBA2902246.1 hypothetical protein [Clostridium beijerinckii]MBA2912069.1 hypothetical protein [Clostridium beijerinckii]MBA9015938.1 hypothetical protein [Clostridium beijerinckii]MBC2418326.1 hypothetical protein [Clostridium beijerinckii]